MKRAERSDKRIVIDILSSSFDTNESINYLVRQDKRRVERLRNLMSYCFEISWRKGHVYLSDHNKGCILVLESDKKVNPLLGLWLVIKVIFTGIGISNLVKVLRRQMALKKYHPKKRHYYFWLMGVFPKFQCQGIGTQLMKEVIEECEHKNRIMFLETFVERNIKLYENFGFRVFQKVDLEFTMYLMLR